MDTTQKLDLSTLIHVLRHFQFIDNKCKTFFKVNEISKSEINSAMMIGGSKFLPNVFSSPFQIFEIISKSKLLTIINQGLTNAYIYEFPDFIGEDNVVNISELTTIQFNSIYLKSRDNILIKTLETDDFPKSKQLVVILENNNNKIRTFFPGKYAPSINKSIESLEFWKQHVILTKKNHGIYNSF